MLFYFIQNVMSKEKRYTRHHRIAKSLGWTNWQPNVRKFEEWKHRAIHYLFWTNWPASQLLQVLEMNDWVWNEEFKTAVLDLLDLFQWNYYNKACHTWDKVYKRDTGNLYSYITK